MDTARGSSCSLCPGATTCKQGGDVVQCPVTVVNKHIVTCNTCMLWVQGSSIVIKDDVAGTDTENNR